MTIASSTLPPVRTLGRSLRTVLVAVAILALATMAFVVGRVTVSSSSAPAKPQVVNLSVPASADTATCQHIGHYMSGGC